MTETILRIRPFRDGDESALISLWQRCRLVVPWNDPLKDIERKREVQPDLFLVGEAGAGLVASAMAGYDGHRGWIYYLAVDPDWRGRGFGRRMVGEARLRLKARGCPKINVLVRTSNAAVVDFYRTIGFAADDVLSLGVRLIDD